MSSVMIHFARHNTTERSDPLLERTLIRRVGRDNSVGIATRYGLNGPGIQSRWWGEIFRTRPDLPWGPLRLLYNGYRVFSGGKTAGAWR